VVFAGKFACSTNDYAPSVYYKSSSSTTSILDQLDITKSDLTDDQLQTGINLIQSLEDIFAKDDINIGNTHVKHRIDLNNDRPFKQRYRRMV
jgi:predicted membrane protein